MSISNGTVMTRSTMMNHSVLVLNSYIAKP